MVKGKIYRSIKFLYSFIRHTKNEEIILHENDIGEVIEARFVHLIFGGIVTAKLVSN